MSLWVFDLDETLVASNIDYARAMMHFVLLMIDVLEHKAPHYRQIIQLEKEIDSDRFKEMHADRQRFPGSLVESYRQLCTRVGASVDPAIEQQCWDLGYSALSEETYQNRFMIPGAEETLQFLLNKKHQVFCVTAGDFEVQWMKWRGYNLSRFFPTSHEFRVVKWGKEDTLKRIRNQYPGVPGHMVGDSIGSDLWPAHGAGLVPVYVPSPSVWNHEELDGKLPPGTISLKQISDLVDMWYEFRG